MPKALSLEQFAEVFPQYTDDLVRELGYATRQEAGKEALASAQTLTPVAKGDAIAFMTIDGRRVKGWLSKGSISQTPGEMKRAWRMLRGSKSVRGTTRVVNARHAAIVNQPYRRLPTGGAVGTPKNPEGITPPTERAVQAAAETIKQKAIARTEAALARKYRT